MRTIGLIMLFVGLASADSPNLLIPCGLVIVGGLLALRGERHEG